MSNKIGIDVAREAFDTPRKYRQCPKCRSTCYRRSGVGFEHEIRCPECPYSFNPDELWANEERERLSYNTFKE